MKNLYQIIHIVGAVQGIFLFLLLVMRKENKTANKILAFLILLVSINLTASFFHTNNDLIMDLPAINRSDAFIFLYGPLLAGYTMFLTGYRRKVTLLQVLQLIPGLCLLLLLLLNRYDIGGLALQGLWDESEPIALRLWFVVHFGALLDMLLYGAYGLSLVYRYDSKLKTFFSNTGRIYLRWLRLLLVSIVFICFVALVQFLFFGFGNTEGPLQWVISTATVMLVFVIGYYTNRQPDILKDLDFIDSTTVTVLPATAATQDKGISETREYGVSIVTDIIPETTGVPETPVTPVTSVTPVISETQETGVIAEALIQPATSARPAILILPATDITTEPPEASGSGREQPVQPGVLKQAAKVKYERNRLGEEYEKSFLDKLIAYVEKNKPYLDPDLDLRQLSELSGIPSHMISMLLNIRLNRNFYTFINAYRVDEAKKLLASEGSKEMNILTIAYDSGFNSKSTFNMLFRKLEGMTPSEYRNKITSNLQYSRN